MMQFNQPLKYVLPDKVYVVLLPSGRPEMVVQRRDIAEVMAKQSGGSYVLVPFYSTEQFQKDFGVQVFGTPTIVNTFKYGQLHVWNKNYKF